jgi:hypothetical protein
MILISSIVKSVKDKTKFAAQITVKPISKSHNSFSALISDLIDPVRDTVKGDWNKYEIYKDHFLLQKSSDRIGNGI